MFRQPMGYLLQRLFQHNITDIYIYICIHTSLVLGQLLRGNILAVKEVFSMHIFMEKTYHASPPPNQRGSYAIMCTCACLYVQFLYHFPCTIFPYFAYSFKFPGSSQVARALLQFHNYFCGPIIPCKKEYFSSNHSFLIFSRLFISWPPIRIEKRYSKGLNHF